MKRKREENSANLNKLPPNGEINTENITSSNENIEIKDAKRQKIFSVKDFRQSLKTADAQECIKQLISLCRANNTTTDYIAQYLDNGGNLMEVVKLLDSADKSNLSFVTPIFELSHIVLLKVQTSYPQQLTHCEEACRHLLSTFITIIHSMLGWSSKPKQKQATLKLLTSIVTLSPLLAKNILVQVDFNSTLLESLTKQADGNSADSVRTAFIHFLLSFMIDGNTSNIRSLLEKRGLVSSIFAELVYDNYELVILVLTTCRQHIVENLLISKTTKLYTFNSSIVKDIVNLYNWKGRKYWKLKVRKKMTTVPEETVNADEKETVTKCVHAFLLVLCTSKKYGLIFHDKLFGLGSKRLNNLIFVVLECVDRPWEHKYASELVTKISIACPDLHGYILSAVDDYIEPRASVKWINVVMFIKNIVQLSTNLPVNDLKELNSKQLVLIVRNFCLPNSILKAFSQNKFIFHGDPYIREVSVDLLLKILQNLYNFLEILEKNNIPHLPTIKQQLYEYLRNVLPSVDNLVKVWSLTENKDIYVESGLLFQEYLSGSYMKLALVELFIYYYEIFSLSLEEIRNEFNPQTILIDLKSMDLNSSNKQSLVIKISELFLLFDSEIFSPDKDYFIEYLDILLENMSTHSFEILRKLFANTVIFENCPQEISLWLEPISSLGTVDNNISKIIGLTLKTAHSNLFQYLTKINEFKNKSEINEKFRDHIDDIIDLIEYGDEKTDSNGNLKENAKYTIVSPMILALLDLLENEQLILLKDDWNYLNWILLNLLHAQTNPNILLEILSTYTCCDTKYAKSLLKHINSWKVDQNPIPLHLNGRVFTFLNQYSEVLLTDSPVSTIFKSNSENVLKLNVFEQEISFDLNLQSYINRNLLQMVVFYFTETMEKKLLTKERLIKYEQLILITFELNVRLRNADKKELLRLIFNNPKIRQNFVPFHSKRNQNSTFVIDLILKLVKYLHANECSEFESLIVPYRQKLLTRIKIASAKYKKYHDVDVMDLIESLHLSNDNCFSIITELIYQPTETFFVDNEFSIFTKILIFALEHVDKYFDEEHFNLLISHYLKLLNFSSEHTLTKVFFDFLKKYPHYLNYLDSKIFIKLINKSPITKIEIDFICYLLKMNNKFVKYINKQFDLIVKNKELILPLVQFLVICKKFDKNNLNIIYTEYEHVVLKSVEKPHKIGAVIRANSQSIVELINHCMPYEKCEKIINRVNKYEIVEEFHLNIIETMYKKCLSVKADSNLASNFIQTLLHLAVNCFKRDDLDRCQTVLKKIDSNLLEIDNLDKVHESAVWNSYVKFSLKYGMTNKNDGFILKTLRQLCEIIYKSNSIEESKLQMVEVVYEMIQSHSEFLNIMLDSGNQEKTEIIHLLLILSKANRVMLVPQLVPVLLGAYQATTNLTDQLILMLLHLYENSDVNLEKYKPFLWGEFAINYYSLRHNAETALWRQPRMYQVLDLLKMDTVLNTIANVNLKRKFSFDELNEDDRKEVKLNRDNFIEFSSEKNRKFVRKDGFSEQNHSVYDLNFLLPLFNSLLSSESVVQCFKFIQSGSLAITLLGLSSDCNTVRQAACSVLSRFYFHLESNRSGKSTKIWIEFINRIRSGISNLCNNTDDSNNIRIPCISAVFLARTSIIISQPLNPLYIPTSNYMFVKESIDFTIVPELLVMFHSADVEHTIFRQWILQVVRDGLKTELDFIIMRKSVAFKMLADFYSSALADSETKLLILQIIESATFVPKCIQFLKYQFGLISWLNGILNKFEKSDLVEIEIVLNIVNNLNNLKIEEDVELICFLLLKILNLLTSKLPVEVFTLYLSLLSQVAEKREYKRLMHEHILKLVQLGTLILGENDADYVAQFGCKFLREGRTEKTDKSCLGKKYLENLVVCWKKNNV